MIDYVAYILVKALNKIFSCVPISASLWLGRRIGELGGNDAQATQGGDGFVVNLPLRLEL